jgi:hypothetical protein
MAKNNLTPDSIVVRSAGTLGASDDYDTMEPNSFGYQSGATANRAAPNNGVAWYLSTIDQGGTHDDSTNERAAQIYFGDTNSYANAGLHYRVKQGTYGWHDWGRILTSVSRGAIIQTQYAGTDAITYTTSPSGFQALKVDITPNHTESKLLVIGNIYGSANDDAHAWLEYRIGGGAWQRNTNLNGAYNSGAAFADFSSIRSLAEPDQQTGFGTSVVFHPNTTSLVEIRVMFSAENTNGAVLNIGMSRDTASSYNNTTTKSTLVVQEIAWGEA